MVPRNISLPVSALSRSCFRLIPSLFPAEVLIDRKNDPSSGYDKAVDLWSLGVILYILLSGTQPFNDNCEIPVLEQVKQGMYSFPPKIWGNVSKEAKDLVQRLLCVDPAKRIDTESVLRHSWMAVGLPAGLPPFHGHTAAAASPTSAATAAAATATAAAATHDSKKRKADDKDKK